MTKFLIAFPVLLLLTSISFAKEIAVTVHSLKADGLADSIGVIVVKETPRGLEFQPYLSGIDPGKYKFTINENVGCGSKYTTARIGIPGMAAGKSIAELPKLVVDQYGAVDQPVVATDLQLKDVRGRTLVISRAPSTPFDLGDVDDAPRVACGSLELYK